MPLPPVEPDRLLPPEGPHKAGDVYIEGNTEFRWGTDRIYERTVHRGDGYHDVEHFGYESVGRDRCERRAISEDRVARRFAAQHAGRLRFCHDAGAWFAWDGAAWRHDRTGLALRLMRELARAVDKEVAEARAHDAVPPSDKAGGTRFLAGAERFARGEAAFAAPAAWDVDPMLIATSAGTVELTTGILRPADPADGITRTTAVAPAETADCPLWRRFLDEITGGDPDLQRFLQRFLGYCLTGETCEHTLLFLHGEGGNGKTVFLNTVAGILGDYAAVAVLDAFTQGAKGGGPTADLAMLAGARLVTASENEEGRAWAEARLKLLTGGDPVTARLPRRKFRTFRPNFKLIVAGNHAPALKTVDAAMRRRFCLVPFAFVPAEPDVRFETKLKTEWPGILRWMIEGCLDWQMAGLVRPESVETATAAYLGGQDLVGQFIEEACETGQPSFTETAAALYAAWVGYARAAGEAPGARRRFAAQLERRGMMRGRTMHARVYHGLRLRAPAEAAAMTHDVNDVK